LSLNRRKTYHKTSYNQWKKQNKNYKYITAYEIVKYEDFKIMLLEELMCNNKKELHIRERHWIEQHEHCCVNKNIPIQTNKEYYNKNKTHITELKNVYKKNNKEQLSEFNKKYYTTNKEVINEKHKQYRNKNKEKIKEYRDQNKNKTKLYNENYYKNIKKKLSQIIKCDICNCEIKLGSLYLHNKTFKHYNNIVKI
tara:strand:+ start:35282 stop:35869 length:588 start_codon:yes stop_codon:yes gene_type:complete